MFHFCIFPVWFFEHFGCKVVIIIEINYILGTKKNITTPIFKSFSQNCLTILRMEHSLKDNSEFTIIGFPTYIAYIYTTYSLHIPCIYLAYSFPIPWHHFVFTKRQISALFLQFGLFIIYLAYIFPLSSLDVPWTYLGRTLDVRTISDEIVRYNS